MDVHRINLHRNIFKEEPIMCFSKFWVSLALTVMFVKQLNPVCINLSCRQFAARCPNPLLCDQETMSTMGNSWNFLLEHKLGNFQCRMEKHLPRLPEKWTTLRAPPKFPIFFLPWTSVLLIRIPEFSEFDNFLIFRELSKNISVPFSHYFESSGVLTEWKVPNIKFAVLNQLLLCSNFLVGTENVDSIMKCQNTCTTWSETKSQVTHSSFSLL